MQWGLTAFSSHHYRTQTEKHAQWIAKEMTGAISLDVPLKVDITYGPTWLDGK
jgi:DNA polymerase I-like protein with 3'-5' exonuclease and polymerase domains